MTGDVVDGGGESVGERWAVTLRAAALALVGGMLAVAAVAIWQRSTQQLLPADLEALDPGGYSIYADDDAGVTASRIRMTYAQEEDSTARPFVDSPRARSLLSLEVETRQDLRRGDTLRLYVVYAGGQEERAPRVRALTSYRIGVGEDVLFDVRVTEYPHVEMACVGLVEDHDPSTARVVELLVQVEKGVYPAGELPRLSLDNDVVVASRHAGPTAVVALPTLYLNGFSWRSDVFDEDYGTTGPEWRPDTTNRGRLAAEPFTQDRRQGGCTSVEIGSGELARREVRSVPVEAAVEVLGTAPLHRLEHVSPSPITDGQLSWSTEAEGFGGSELSASYLWVDEDAEGRSEFWIFFAGALMGLAAGVAIEAVKLLVGRAANEEGPAAPTAEAGRQRAARGLRRSPQAVRRRRPVAGARSRRPR